MEGRVRLAVLVDEAPQVTLTSNIRSDQLFGAGCLHFDIGCDILSRYRLPETGTEVPLTECTWKVVGSPLLAVVWKFGTRVPSSGEPGKPFHV